MPADRSADSLSRRKALRIIVGSASAAAGLPAWGKPLPGSMAVCSTASPPAALPSRHTAQFFTPEQLEEVAALAETIIPTDDYSPGARAAAVHEYIDDVLAVADQKTRDLWTSGLAAVNSMAQRSGARSFAQCEVVEQIELVERLAANEDHPQTLEEQFFVALKQATVQGYYTSAVGIHQDLHYQGNQALPDFPGCTHPQHK